METAAFQFGVRDTSRIRGEFMRLFQACYPDALEADESQVAALAELGKRRLRLESLPASREQAGVASDDAPLLNNDHTAMDGDSAKVAPAGKRSAPGARRDASEPRGNASAAKKDALLSPPAKVQPKEEQSRSRKKRPRSSDDGDLADEKDESTVPSTGSRGRITRAQVDRKGCALCPPTHMYENQAALVGPFKQRQRPKEPTVFYLHEDCCQWSPHVYTNKAGQVVGVVNAFYKTRQTVCAHCQSLHACVPCEVANCSRVYHLLCLKPAKCNVLKKSLKAFCPEHAPSKPKNSKIEGAKKAAKVVEKTANEFSDGGGAQDNAQVTLASDARNTEALSEEFIHLYNKAYNRRKDPAYLPSYFRQNRDKQVIFSARLNRALSNAEVSLRTKGLLTTLSASGFVSENRPTKRKGYLLLLRSMHNSFLLKQLQTKSYGTGSSKHSTRSVRSRQNGSKSATASADEDEDEEMHVKSEPVQAVPATQEQEISSGNVRSRRAGLFGAALGREYGKQPPASAPIHDQLSRAQRSLRLQPVSQMGVEKAADSKTGKLAVKDETEEADDLCSRCGQLLSIDRLVRGICSSCESQVNKTRRAADAERRSAGSQQGSRLEQIFPAVD